MVLIGDQYQPVKTTADEPRVSAQQTLLEWYKGAPQTDAEAAALHD